MLACGNVKRVKKVTKKKIHRIPFREGPARRESSSYRLGVLAGTGCQPLIKVVTPTLSCACWFWTCKIVQTP